MTSENDKRHNSEQIAFKEMMEKDSVRGTVELSAEDTKAYIDLNNEMEKPHPGFRVDQADLDGAHWEGPHVHMKGVRANGDHIKVESGVKLDDTTIDNSVEEEQEQSMGM